jgi:hypothetical protein
MDNQLSPNVEQKIAEAISGGLYSSREALLEAGVVHLLYEQLPMVPDDHMALVEAAIESSDAGHSVEMTRHEWDELRNMVRNIADGNYPSHQ